MKKLTLFAVAMVALLSLGGCAGSGPNGQWTAQDTAALSGALTAGVNTGVGAYKQIRYPDRPYTPPYNAAPVIPVSPAQ